MSETVKSNTIELRFEYSDDSEVIQAHLALWSPTGFLDDEGSWSCYFTDHDWNNNCSEIESMLGRMFPGLKYSIEIIQSRNWNEEWERSIEPIDASRRFIIAPSWHPVDVPDNRFLLLIDPKMSFGTGFHATTRLMLRLMEEADFNGKRVLDVGTGTGILAIAAVKLGAESALGIDIDEWSFDNAMENAVRNNVESNVRVQLGTIDVVEGMFDIILANITRNDNINMMSRYIDLLDNSGVLLLSGFTPSDVNQIIQHARQIGLTRIRWISEEDWAAVKLERE